MIPEVFITHATDILGDTSDGLTGSKIAELCTAYAIEYDVDIPYTTYPFPPELQNKRTALRENLKAFTSEQQYRIIKTLCELPQFSGSSTIKDLRIKLITRYSEFGNTDSEVSEALIEETRHWLADYPDSLKVYEDALAKFAGNIFQRNTLDDLRLSLEILLKKLLGNEKSLENQLADVGSFVQGKGGSKELVNMFVKLIDYYAKYQNTYIKHNDSVVEAEIEIILEMTSSLMKFLLRIK
ncbi:hypothetical protein HQ585_05515 [candidate division KSB1 bacterium]|nr:hypothetical protein [candidate division KSB1 bacterium]